MRTWVLKMTVGLGMTLTLAVAYGQQQPGDRPRVDPQFLREAAEGMLTEQLQTEDTEASAVDASGLAPESTASIGKPDGRERSRGQEAVAVTIQPRRMKRGAPKAGRTGRPWRRVTFSSGAFIPHPGLDATMAGEVASVKAEGRAFIYGFLLTDEDPGVLTLRELQSRGVTVLGPHDDLLKVKLPADLVALDGISRLPHVEWVGNGAPWQKLSPELSATLRSAASSSGELPIIINLLDDDRDGAFRRRLEQEGAVLARYDSDLQGYSAVASPAVIEEIARLDFVLFVELILPAAPAHDQSTPLIGADLIRSGSSQPTFDALRIPLGIMDTGFDIGEGGHVDLNKFGCGRNFTDDSGGNGATFNDINGHGTHVLGTVCGTGTAEPRFRGVATGMGNKVRIRAAKVFRNNVLGTGQSNWFQNAMDWLDDNSACGGESPRPMLVNFSGGISGTGLTGTDATSRKLDAKTWDFRQLYVVAAGNEGPFLRTLRSPAVAKSALTVGNVQDSGLNTVDVIAPNSSRGPTGDGRMKPNLVAPGLLVTSTRNQTTNQYRDLQGTSMAAPHVTGLAATLMEHYSEFKWRPQLIRAVLMATTLLPNQQINPTTNSGALSGRGDYGLGRVSAIVSHFANNHPEGWFTRWAWGDVNRSTRRQMDISVPQNARRLVVVMTFDEPAASAGAAAAVHNDVDLWVDRGADCTGQGSACGEFSSQSSVDNVEYVIIENPERGTYRLKAIPFDVDRGRNLPVGIAATVVRGEPAPDINVDLEASTTTPWVGGGFAVSAIVRNESWVASGVDLALTALPPGITLLSTRTLGYDDVTKDFGAVQRVTVGDIPFDRPRTTGWVFRNDTGDVKTIRFRATSGNAGFAESELTITPTVPVPPIP